MKILHIFPYSPVPPIFGGALRVYHMLRMMARDHDVTVAVFAWDKALPEFRREFDGRVRGIHTAPYNWSRRNKRAAQFISFWAKHSFFYTISQSREMQRTLDGIVAKNDFDIIQSEFPTMGDYNFQSDAVRILDSHNVEYDVFRRMWQKARSPLRKLHYYDEFKKFYHEELAVYKKQDALFVTSERDKMILDADIPGVPKYVVPNGVDSAYFAPKEQTTEPHSLVFTGALSYIPNSDGVLYFLDSVFPLIQRKIPDAKIYVVGMGPPRELRRRASESVIVTDYVDDVRPYVHRSSVYVVPLRMGGGTRLKVLEAMAMKKPIVSTSIGCEGIQVKDGESIRIADTPEAFADSTVELLRNSALRSRLSENGFEIMKAQYEWNVIGADVNKLYEKICSGKRNERNIRN